MRATLGILLAGALLALTAASGRAGTGESKVDPLLAELGAGEYARYCAACHGVTGVGDGPVAASLKHTPSDLTRIAARRGGRFPAAEIARFIDGRFDVKAHGTREMPVWGERLGEDVPDTELAESVTRGKIAVLIEYLKSIQRPLVSGK